MAGVSSSSLRGHSNLSLAAKLQRFSHQGAPEWDRVSPVRDRSMAPLSLPQGLPETGCGGVGVLTSLPLARAKPPPSRSMIFQGIFSFTVFQLRRAGGPFSFPGFPAPQAQEDGSPRVNRPSFPSTWCLLYGSLSELNVCGRVPESLCPWQVTPATQGFVYSCQIWSKCISCRKAGAARRPFPAPVQVLTWILSQPWDLGGHDEHNYADEDGHCPIGHDAMGGAGRAGLVAQGCLGMQGGGGGREEALPQMGQLLLASVPFPPSRVTSCSALGALFPSLLLTWGQLGEPLKYSPPSRMLTFSLCRREKPGCPSRGKSLAPE